MNFVEGKRLELSTHALTDTHSRSGNCRLPPCRLQEKQHGRENHMQSLTAKPVVARNRMTLRANQQGHFQKTTMGQGKGDLQLTTSGESVSSSHL
jgi:hypothetical protein